MFQELRRRRGGAGYLSVTPSRRLSMNGHAFGREAFQPSSSGVSCERVKMKRGVESLLLALVVKYCCVRVIYFLIMPPPQSCSWAL